MITKMGKYLCTYCPGHHRATKEGYVYTHILVAEEKLGRELTDNEVVHHIDENKYNNYPDNLIVFKTKADHTAFHHGSKSILENDVWICPDKKNKSDDKWIICPKCNKNKMRSSSRICKKCNSHESKEKIRKVERPNKEELYDLLMHNNNFTYVAKLYGVTDNAVRKWCKTYDIPYKTSDYIKLNIL